MLENEDQMIVFAAPYGFVALDIEYQWPLISQKERQLDIKCLLMEDTPPPLW